MAKGSNLRPELLKISTFYQSISNLIVVRASDANDQAQYLEVCFEAFGWMSDGPPGQSKRGAERTALFDADASCVRWLKIDCNSSLFAINR